MKYYIQYSFVDISKHYVSPFLNCPIMYINIYGWFVNEFEVNSTAMGICD
jgi:hypothetical protein